MDFLKQQVDNSHPDFTIGFLLDQLGPDHLGPQGKEGIRTAEAAPLKTGGFISDLYRLKVHFRDGRPSFQCVFKVPTTKRLDGEVKYDEDVVDELVEWCFWVHNAECRFYSEVAPLLRSAPFSLPFRMPQLYAMRLCPSKMRIAGGFILMEDLCPDGQKPLAQVDFSDSLSKGQVESTLCGLAQYHALCLWLPQSLVESFQLKEDLNFDDSKLHIVERLIAAEDVRVGIGAEPEELTALFARAGFIEADQHKQFGMAPVITHGDFWTNNFFFESNADGKPGDKLEALFDWQVVYSGTGLNDLVRLFFTCVDAKLRRAHQSEWLALYCTELNVALAKLGIALRPFELVRRVAAFHAEYECCFAIFLCTNVLGGEKDQSKRDALIRRCAALLEDCRRGFFFEE